MSAVQITSDQLLQIMITARERASLFVVPLQQAMDRFDISATPQRAAAFLAQIAHESCELRYLRELWGPTPDQVRYEGRLDLGNTEPGDGFAFRGWGFIQVTGRANTLKASEELFGDDRLVRDPELLGAKDLACVSAGLFWKDHGLNELADADEFEALSIRINGKNRVTGLPNGWLSRQAYWAKAKAVLG